MDDDALVTLDFISKFPHKWWISNWANDEHYPDGYRYKCMSARNEPEDEIELLIVLQHRNGEKEVMKSLVIEMTAFDRVASTFINGLAEAYGLDFEEQDFSTCRTVRI